MAGSIAQRFVDFEECLVKASSVGDVYRRYTQDDAFSHDVNHDDVYQSAAQRSLEAARRD
jgi:hypothetical protein